MSPGTRIGYVVKAFPRISETFIINEVLELERRGLDLHVYSIIPPPDTTAHAFVERVRAPVTYLDLRFLRSPWTVLAGHTRLLVRRPGRYVRMAIRAYTSGDHERKERFRQAVVLARAVRRDGIRHLHAGFVHAPGTVVWKVHRLTGIPYSAAGHARDIYFANPNDLANKLARARFVLSCTDYAYAHLEELIGGERLRRVHHGVDLDTFRFGPHGIDHPPVVLAVARLVAKKGLDTLIEACQLLLRRGRTFQCRLVGAGENERELADLVRALDLQDVVHFEGALEQEEVRGWYRRATVMALPCRITPDGDRDGLPNVLVEAAASGLPIVSTPVSGIPELVRDGDTGILVEPSDPRGLANAIERLLEDAELRERLRTNARAVVEREFDLRRNAEIVVDQLRAAIDSPAPSQQSQARAAISAGAPS